MFCNTSSRCSERPTAAPPLRATYLACIASIDNKPQFTCSPALDPGQRIWYKCDSADNCHLGRDLIAVAPLNCLQAADLGLSYLHTICTILQELLNTHSARIHSPIDCSDSTAWRIEISELSVIHTVYCTVAYKNTQGKFGVIQTKKPHFNHQPHITLTE